MATIDLNIFIPDFTQKKTRCQHFIGYVVTISEDKLGLYLNDYYPANPEKNERDHPYMKCCSRWPYINDGSVLHGYITEKNCNEMEERSLDRHLNYVHLETENRNIELKTLKVNGEILDVNSRVRNNVVIFFNHDTFGISECLFHSPDSIDYQKDKEDTCKRNQFEVLKTIINYRNHSCVKEETSHEFFLINYFSKLKTFFDIVFGMLTPLLNYSNLYIQMCQFLKIIQWIVQSIKDDKKVAVKTGNLITALIINILGGAIILFWINRLSTNPMNELFNLIELIVESLKSLLKWLMGSPAGLKLNHAFNNMLGKFFLYHIDLWWMFLVIAKNVLEIALHGFQLLGMLGITFQAAILADLLSLISFHIYCIYTYAARLYYIQLSGLISLCRLFLGRKHNPLRGGVDSCQYNHHQLFIGTLAFTILLFLLPTTALYYAVFTIFRVILILMSGLLRRIQYFVQSFPLYLFILWIINSPKVAGDIKITVLESDSGSKLICLLLELKTASFFQIIKIFEPTPITKPESIKWKEIFSSLWRGNLMYPV